MSKLVVLCAVIAVARAGDLLAAAPAVAYHAGPAVASLGYSSPYAYSSYAAPYAYSSYTSPVAVHAPAIGTSHQSTVRSLDGNSAVSHYSKSVDTAFSSVRKVDTRVTNDAKFLTPAVTYAAAPIVKAAPVVAPTAHLTYAAPAVHLTYAAAPSAPVAYAAHAAPLSYAAAAPSHVVSHHTTFSGLGTAYAF